jgi:peptide/nickel transport system permease protein
VVVRIDTKRRKELSQGQLARTWRSFRRHKLAVASLVFLAVLIAVAALGTHIMPCDPLKIDLKAVPGGRPAAPSAAHWLGTDEMGRDVFSRLISGARVSLMVGLVASGLSLVFGVTLGAVAGFFGGLPSSLIMRTADIFLSLPRFFLIMVVNAYLTPSVYNIMAVIGLFSWMGVARLVRGEFLRLKEQEFITATKALGVPTGRVILRHLLPNSVAPIIVAATLQIPYAILTESSLSFLGLGIAPPLASWGSMLNLAKPYIATAWWLWVPAGVLISLAVFAFNFVGDGLRDALDPLQHRR